MTDEGMTELRRVYPWAADEIERLRAEVARWNASFAGHVYVPSAEYSAQAQDRDRLRAALERIAGHVDCAGDGWDMREIARAALGDAETGTVAPDCPRCNAPLDECDCADVPDQRGEVPASASPNIAESNDRADASPMDEGPWYVLGDKVSGDLIGVGSDDFKRDVLLRVDGDFKCDMEKADYCAWLARTLNLNSGLSHCPHCGQWHDLKLGC